MKKSVLKIFVLSLLIALNSCTPDNTTSNIVNSSPINPSVFYIAGSKDGFACYWKNNQLIQLNSGTLSESYAEKIIESNGDVYVFGYGYVANVYKRLFWKNGVLTNLTNQLATVTYSVNITDMNVIGNDVYFVGFTYPKPFNSNNPSSLVYWKNNMKSVIANYPTTNYSQSRIEIVNNDVYALGAGNMNFSDQGYYVNGVYNELLGIDLYGISVNKNNNDVYITGRASGNYYCKNITNNTLELIPSNFTNYIEIDFDEFNNKYYRTGKKIFKNGVLFYDGSSSVTSVLQSFKILNNNTYILNSFGYDAVNSGYTCLNINGNNVMQSANNESYSSFFVVQN